MVRTISIVDVKKKLKEIFCAENKVQRKYAEVWLSDVEFGGLYHFEKQIVNVKVDHHIDSCNDEIKYIFSHLLSQLEKDELAFIWRVVVYNAEEQVHCQSEDILVFSTLEAC